MSSQVSQAHHRDVYDLVKDRSKSYPVSIFFLDPLFIERNRYWENAVQSNTMTSFRIEYYYKLN